MNTLLLTLIGVIGFFIILSDPNFNINLIDNIDNFQEILLPENINYIIDIDKIELIKNEKNETTIFVNFDRQEFIIE